MAARFPMSTIEDVRAAEKKMKDILAALRGKDDMLNSDDLHEELRKATDEYTKAVRDLDRWREQTEGRVTS